MAKEKIERNEVEEVKKTTNPKEVSDLKEKEDEIQGKTSKEETSEEETIEEKPEDVGETAEEAQEESDTDSKAKGREILLAAFIVAVIIIIIGIIVSVFKPEEKEPEKTAVVEQVQEEAKQEEVVAEAPEENIPEEAVADAEAVEEVADVVDEEAENTTEQIEVVDFEDWMAQMVLEDPCLVAWNANGKQEIIPVDTKYIPEEGDILAVPGKMWISPPYVNSTMQTLVKTDKVQYYLIVLEEKWNTVDFTYEGTEYNYVVKNIDVE